MFRTHRDPFDVYCEEEFIQHFRLSKQAALDLLSKIQHLIPNSVNNRAADLLVRVFSTFATSAAFMGSLFFSMVSMTCAPGLLIWSATPSSTVKFTSKSNRWAAQNPPLPHLAKSPVSSVLKTCFRVKLPSSTH